MDNKIIIFLPLSFKFLAFKNCFFSYFYFFNKNFFFFQHMKNQHFFFNIYLNYFCLKSIKNISNFFATFLYSWHLFFINKYLIFGKGFKLKKKQKFSLWKFNRSHFFKMFFNCLILHKINKKKFFLYSKNISIKALDMYIEKIFYRNIFLKKQIKKSRTYFILKKKKN